MAEPKVNIGTVSNIFVRQMHFESIGDSEQAYQNTHDHLTLLAKGRLKVTINDSTTTYDAPSMIFIKSNMSYTLTAEAPNTVTYCIYGIRDGAGDLIDPGMIPAGTELYMAMTNLTNAPE
jgi:quercetin dioxygenase-like cupin family protein